MPLRKWAFAVYLFVTHRHAALEQPPPLQGALRKWASIYLEMTSLKGISSMKLHRELKVTQKTAWFILHRLPRRLGR